MIRELAFYMILGKPVLMYMGILTYIMILLTASISVLNVRYKIHLIPFKWHPRIAALAIILATLHGVMGMSIYFRF